MDFMNTQDTERAIIGSILLDGEDGLIKAAEHINAGLFFFSFHGSPSCDRVHYPTVSRGVSSKVYVDNTLIRDVH